MRIAVTGRTGQVSRALQEVVAPRRDVELVVLDRPQLDLADRRSVHASIRQARPDIVINAAAFTAVDKAEDDEATARAVNADGAGHVAEAAAELGIPIFQLSTDYVFDGGAGRPYVEADTPAPINAYGRTKLAGERAVAINPRHAIFRTSWVHSPFGPNFILSMLRLAKTRRQIDVVADQRGAPTPALDIAAALLPMAEKMLAKPDDPNRNGVFHLTALGSTSWAIFAAYVFECSRASHGPYALVERVSSADYPTRARRPSDSRLDSTRLWPGYGVRLHDWQIGAGETVSRILADATLLG